MMVPSELVEGTGDEIPGDGPPSPETRIGKVV
jgi:hypothetical protein